MRVLCETYTEAKSDCVVSVEIGGIMNLETIIPWLPVIQVLAAIVSTCLSALGIAATLLIRSGRALVAWFHRNDNKLMMVFPDGSLFLHGYSEVKGIEALTRATGNAKQLNP